MQGGAGGEHGGGYVALRKDIAVSEAAPCWWHGGQAALRRVAAQRKQPHRERAQVPLTALVRVKLVGHAVLLHRRKENRIVRRDGKLVVDHLAGKGLRDRAWLVSSERGRHGLQTDAEPAAAIDDRTWLGSGRNQGLRTLAGWQARPTDVYAEVL